MNQPTELQQAVYQPPPQAQAVWSMTPPNPKTKALAVVLAIFLGFWTWVYTYQKDGHLFWINLALSLLTFGFWGIFVAWPWAIIAAAIRPSEFYAWYPNYPVRPMLPESHPLTLPRPSARS